MQTEYWREENERQRLLQEEAAPMVEALRQAAELGIFQKQRKEKTEAPEAPARDLSLTDLMSQPAVIPEIVTGLLPATGVHCLIGDSHLGKTPLVIQLAICIASGKPFLGMPVQRTKVLLADFENSEAELRRMVVDISAHVGVSLSPDWFGVFAGEPRAIIKKAEQFGAGLIIVDALRGLDPDAQEKASDFAKLVELLGRFAGSWLLIHHIRKNAVAKDEQRKPLQEEDSVMTWLQVASGTRAIINQTAMRLAIDNHSKADLILRGAYKSRSEVGPFLISREMADGEPVGYVLATGRHLLSLNHGHMLHHAEGKTL